MFIDPSKPADNALYFAELFMMNAFGRLDAQKENAASMSEALAKLSEAMQAFQSGLTALTSQQSLLRLQASLLNPAMGTVSAGAGAQPGSYAFFVEQLASAHQLQVGNMMPVPAAQTGMLTVNLADGSTFNVDLSAAKPDANGDITPAEMARAINQASGNSGKVTATVVTINGQQQLVMSSGKSGLEGEITLDTSGIIDGGLKAALDGAGTLTPPKNAVFYLGGENGTRIEQFSNTFTGIDGVSVTFSQAMASGDPSLLLTVSRDNQATADGVKSFVDAYNALKQVLDELALSGNAAAGIEAGPMAGDASIRSLQQRLNEMLRGAAGGSSLFDFGVSADRYGKLSFDQTKFEKKLESDPAALDTLFSDPQDGLGVKLDDYLKSWLSSTDGHIKTRKDSVQKIQNQLSNRETALQAQYNRVYERYLTQFTRVQQLDQRMKETLGLLDALFGSESK